MFLSVQELLVMIGVNMIFLSLEAQRVNKKVKKQRKQQRGGGGEGEGRGVSSIIVSHIALLRMYFIVNFFLSVFVL